MSFTYVIDTFIFAIISLCENTGTFVAMKQQLRGAFTVNTQPPSI